MYMNLHSSVHCTTCSRCDSHAHLGADMESTTSGTNVHEIVLLGLHHSGIRCAHYILRHVIPGLLTLDPSRQYHLTIVAPHTDFFWNPGSARYLVDVSEKSLPIHKLYLPIAPAFERYDKKDYKFVNGKATAVDDGAQTVTVTTAAGEQTIKYRSLIIATGTYSTSPLWRMNCSQEETKAAYEQYKTALISAKTILVAGGGAVGVETAGEIAVRYPKAKVKLLSGSYRLLPRCAERTGKRAQAKLLKLGIEIEHGIKVNETIQQRPEMGQAMGRTSVRFSNLTEESYDVYLDATGSKPSTEFLPRQWCDERGYVAVNSESLRVRDTNGVYAIGDCATHSDGTIIATIRAASPCCLSLAHDIANSFGANFSVPTRPASNLKGTLMIPVGPNSGVGEVLGKWLPSPIVWLIKCRDYTVWLAPLAVKGADVSKA